MLQDRPLCPIPSVLAHSIPRWSAVLVHFPFRRLQAPQGRGACFIFLSALSTVPEAAQPSVSCWMLRTQASLWSLTVFNFNGSFKSSCGQPLCCNRKNSFRICISYEQLCSSCSESPHEKDSFIRRQLQRDAPGTCSFPRAFQAPSAKPAFRLL